MSIVAVFFATGVHLSLGMIRMFAEIPMSSDNPSGFEKTSRRWELSSLVSVAVYTAFVVIVTIGLMQRTAVANREAEITVLKHDLEIAKALPKTAPNSNLKETSHGVLSREDSVLAGSSVISPDGRCQVLVSSIIGESVDLTVTINSDSPRGFTSLHPGNRLTVGDYFIDLHRVRGDIADLSISIPY